jgi:hypothetical protein
MARFPLRPFYAIMSSAQSLAADLSGILHFKASEPRLRTEIRHSQHGYVLRTHLPNRAL